MANEIINVGETVVQPDMVDNHDIVGTFEITATYKEITYGQEYPIQHLHDIFTNMTQQDAYELWRDRNWKTLFDPFKVKLLSLRIEKM